MLEGKGGFINKRMLQQSLITKIEGATKVNFLKQISLCNFVYKTIFKIIMNRSNRILPKNVLGTWWFLMEIDGNYRGMDGDCKEIDLIRNSHPP